jgi:basic membrane lipoprotein Med (substrate-binding protein (PBP1-ABC) superfamily)
MRFAPSLTQLAAASDLRLKSNDLSCLAGDAAAEDKEEDLISRSVGFVVGMCAGWNIST